MSLEQSFVSQTGAGGAPSAVRADGRAPDDQHGMQLWNDKQYAAWVSFGSTAVIAALYWLQSFYAQFAMAADKKKYASTIFDSTKWNWNTYSMWGIAQNINVVTLLVQYVPTAIVWILTCTNDDGLIWFFVTWCGIMTYVNAIRFLVVGIVKVISFWYDNATSVNSYSGLTQTYEVSKNHEMTYWDFATEWLCFMVFYGGYMDLHTIIEDINGKTYQAPKVVIQRPQVVIDTPRVNVDVDVPRVNVDVDVPRVNVDVDVRPPRIDVRTPDVRIPQGDDEDRDLQF